LILNTKGQISLLVNHKISNPGLDNFFIYYTWLGLGSVFAVIVVLSSIIRFYYLIIGTAILVLTGIFTFIFKQLLFKGLPRPTKFFDTDSLNLIEGFDYHSMNSFPSGHTITAFAMAVFLVFMFNRKISGIVLFLIAALIGFSRIYLLQHFFVDVYVGMILGILSAVIVIYIFEKQTNLKSKRVFQWSLVYKREK